MIGVTSFIVFTGDEKHGVLYPEIVGPFPSDAAADRFLERLPRYLGGGVMEPLDGGYAGAVLVSVGTATDPEAHLAEAEEYS